MRVLVVRNAGSGSAGDVTQGRLAEALSPLGDVAFESPESDDELRHAAEAMELVVAAGGDGTVSRTVGALADRLADLTFAVVPLGTGNDFARTLGMPEDPLEAARPSRTAPTARSTCGGRPHPTAGACSSTPASAGSPWRSTGGSATARSRSSARSPT